MQLKKVIQQFKNRKVLLLQGPVGPFFYHFARGLKNNQAQVYKINFNGGDFIFYPFGAKSYRGSLQNFESFLQDFCKIHNIDCIIMFNDCRPIHKIAIQVADCLGLQTYIFEEGYIRPNFITFENKGVNANSTLPKDPNFYLTHKEKSTHEEKNVKHSFRNMAWFAFLYWFNSFLFAWYFNNKLHHRSLSFTEMFPWFLSFLRKQWYKISEKEDREFILDSKENYFVLILQVYNDTQIKNHFEGRRIENFIKNSIRSFAKYSKITANDPGTLSQLKQTTSVDITAKSWARSTSIALSTSETIKRRIPKSAVSAILNACMLILLAPNVRTTSLIRPVLFSKKTDNCLIVIYPTN